LVIGIVEVDIVEHPAAVRANSKEASLNFMLPSRVSEPHLNGCTSLIRFVSATYRLSPKIQQQPSCVCLSELCRDMKRIRASRVRLTP